MKKWLFVLFTFFSAFLCQAATEPATPSQNADTITIYFARHGKTLLNTFDRVQGWADSPLTDEGIQDARYLGEGLKGIHFDRFYSSDAGRQRETMQVLLKQAGVTDYTLTELKGLRETFFGGFEGDFNRTMTQAAARQLGLQDADALYRKMRAGEVPIKDSMNAIAAADPKKMAENYDQIKKRTQAALQTIIDNAKANGDKTILAISSGTAIQIMISDLTPDRTKDKPLLNAAVVKLQYQNGKYTVTEIGDMRYVEAGKKALAERGE